MNTIIRKKISQKRKLVSKNGTSAYSLALLKNFQQLKLNLASKKVASYLAVNGEMPATSLHVLFRNNAQSIYLPILNKEQLLFGKWDQNSKLIKNKFNIAEPIDTKPLTAEHLDVILVPLVAFKEDGNRLGMGGGFYDKTLGGVPKKKRPLLIGIAYEFQKNEGFDTHKWDIPLDITVTDKHIYNHKEDLNN